MGTDTHTGRRHVKMKVEIRVMLPQAKEPQELQQRPQKPGERHGTRNEPWHPDLDF